jgi:hypothetical protein
MYNPETIQPTDAVRTCLNYTVHRDPEAKEAPNMSEKRATQGAKEMNHLAIGLCAGILLGLVMGSLALGLVFGITIGGMLDTWDADRHA